MKYFFDTEFSEGFRSPLFGKKYHTIDFISIGIVSEEGDKYYAISNEFNPYTCNEWVQENVLKKIVEEFVLSFNDERRNHFHYKLENKTIPQQMRVVQSEIGKSQSQIAKEILKFVNPELLFHNTSYKTKEKLASEYWENHFKKHNVKEIDGFCYAQPEFYAYYADYDWVVFCSLFGTMMDLPEGFPMYCIDLKQTIDEKAKGTKKEFPELSTEECLKLIKSLPDYPTQENEHNALDDAKWNKKLYNFLNGN